MYGSETDFGLALDRRFALDESEKLFFRQNTYYDYGEFLSNLGFHLYSIYEKMSVAKKRKINHKYGLEEDSSHHERLTVFVKNIDKIHANGIMKLDSNYVEIVAKYSSIMLLMGDFFHNMWSNNKKDTKYSHTRLRRLLKETGFVPTKTS